MSIFTIAAILVGLSALFGYVNHRQSRLPHTIGLVVIALANLHQRRRAGIDLGRDEFN